MAVNVDSWSTTPSQNTSVDGEDTSITMMPSNVDGAIRAVMAGVATVRGRCATVSVKDFGAVGSDILKPLVIIVAGQSNAVGSSGLITNVIGQSFFWDNNTQKWITPIKNPVWPTPFGGFIPALALYINKYARRPCYIINVAVAGSNCATDIHSSNGSWASNGTLRARAETIYSAAIAEIDSEYDVLGTIWMQGESDVLRIASNTPGVHEEQSDYDTTVHDTMDWMLSTFGGDVFIAKIGYLQTEFYDITVNIVNGILEDCADDSTDVHIASSIALSFRKDWKLRDEYHYTQPAYNELGNSLGAYIVSNDYVSKDTALYRSGVDSTSAFESASATNRAIFVPEGVYRVTSAVTGRFYSNGNVLTYPVYTEIINIRDGFDNLNKNVNGLYEDNPYLNFNSNEAVIQLKTRPLIIDGVEQTPAGEWDYHKYVELSCGGERSPKIRIHQVDNYNQTPDPERDPGTVDDFSDTIEVIPGVEGSHYGNIVTTYLSSAPTASNPGVKHNLTLQPSATRSLFSIYPQNNNSVNLGHDDSIWSNIYCNTLLTTYINEPATKSRCLAFTSSFVRTSKEFRPGADNTFNLGTASLRWKEIYAANGTINTSDAREKQQISAYSDDVLDAWGDVELRTFLFNDAVERKGASARIHSGVVAQQVAQAFRSHGLEPSRYALFCYDEWDDEYEDVEIVDAEATYDEDGNELTPRQTHMEHKLMYPAGNRYGIRYSEALIVEAAYQRRRADRMEARIAALEAKLGDE